MASWVTQVQLESMTPDDTDANNTQCDTLHTTTRGHPSPDINSFSIRETEQPVEEWRQLHLLCLVVVGFRLTATLTASTSAPAWR